MQNIVPSRILERRSRRLILGAALLMLFGVFVAAVGAFLYAIELVVPSNPSFDLYNLIRQVLIGVGLFLVVVSVVFIIRALTWRMDNELAEKTANALQDFLDERYVFIRNVSKRKLGYIDAVLVGPSGLLVFRITDRVGTYFNEKGHWLQQRDQGDWRTLRWNPTKEVVADIQRLREYLSEKGLTDIPVFGVIVFVNDRPMTQFSLQEPLVPAFYTDQLAYELNDTYFAKQRLESATIRRIVAALMN